MQAFREQRYVCAFERYRLLVGEYRVLVGEYRADKSSSERDANLKDRILLYRKRCEQMRMATNPGVAAAILWLTTLICGGVEAVFGGSALVKYTVRAIFGLLLVIAAAGYVIAENTLIKRALDSEIAVLGDVANSVRHKK